MDKKIKFLVVVLVVVTAMVCGIIYEQSSERAAAEKLMSDALNSKNNDIISFDGTKTERGKIISRGSGEIDIKNKKLHLYTDNIKKGTSTEIYFIDNRTYIKLGEEWFRPEHFIAFEWMFDSSQNKNWDLLSFIPGSMKGENILSALSSFQPQTSNVTLILKGKEIVEGQECRIVEGVYPFNSSYTTHSLHSYKKKYWISEDTHKVIQMEEILPDVENLRNETTITVKYNYDKPIKIILPEEAKNAQVVGHVPMGAGIEIGMKGSKTPAKVGVKGNGSNGEN